MKKVFIGGSRSLSRLNADIRRRIDRIVERHLFVLVGDANGADKAVQDYLSNRHYPHVIVYSTGGQCRNNLGGWPNMSVEPPHRTKDFQFFTAKDAAMAHDADFGLMLWDGRSPGTMVNVARMLASGKPVVVYVAKERIFRTLRSRSQLQLLLGPCPTEVRQRTGRYIAQHGPEHVQATMF